MDSSKKITVTCPKCQHKFSVDEALVPQIADATARIREELNQQAKDWLKNKEESLRKEAENKLRKELIAENEKELKILQDQNEQQKKELEKAHDYELSLRKKTQELEEKEKNLELEKQRQIDEERKKIQEKTEEELSEKFLRREKDKDQYIESLKKSLDDAQRKANQGSQQSQGEVMELELEELLKKEFPVDEILEVGKGVKGADVTQIVKDKIGKEAGKIIWESKRTKAFGGDWIEKLKEDMRETKADVAVLVSTTLPQGINQLGFKDGVYITSFETFLQLAQLLRKSIIEITATKALSVGKNEKIESLYRYITSSEFAQKIDFMLGIYSKMRQNLEKEKILTQRRWAEEEKQIERLQTNTLTIHGSLAGLIDEPLSLVNSLEIAEEIEIEVAEENFLK